MTVSILISSQKKKNHTHQIKLKMVWQLSRDPEPMVLLYSLMPYVASRLEVGPYIPKHEAEGWVSHI